MSSLSESITSWESDNGVIRVTSEGQPSVFDMIKVLGGLKNPRKTWKRLCSQYPEVVPLCYNLQFPGPGQRPTPVTKTKEDAYQILGLLPGEVGKKYRKEAAELFVKFLEDPKGLAADIADNLSQEDQNWLEARLTVKRTRLQTTDCWKAHGVEGIGYAQCTNAIYRPLLGKTAKEMKEDIAKTKNLPIKSIKPRDHMTLNELAELNSTEQVAIKQVEIRNLHGNKDVTKCCEKTSQHMRDLFDGNILIPM